MSTPRHRGPLAVVRPVEEIWGDYNRISDDSQNKARGEAGSGVARQGLDAAGAIALRGGVASKHYVEDDTSAFKQKRIMRFDPISGNERPVYRVIRPVWQAMLQDLRDGVITSAMVYDLDRMARDPRDLEDAIEVVEHFGATIYGVGGDIDLTTDNGRFAARLAVSMANKSSADTRRRVTRKHLALSTSGKPVGGPRPFGWSDDRLTLHPVESVHLRRWIDMSLHGASWSEIVMDSQTRGVTGTRGRPMVKSSLRQLLFSPRNCGYRMFHGEIVKVDGAQVVGQWETICTTEEWDALTSSRIIPRSQSTGLPRTAKYLLSGIARCGVCKSRMRGVRRRVGEKNYDSYVCPPKAEGGKQCVARNIAEVDRLVTDTLMEVKLPPAGAASASAGWDRQAALTSAEARLEGYVQDAARGKITDSMLYRMLPIIEEEISELQKVKAAWLQSRNQRMLATTTWDAATWGKLTVNQKRGALSAVILAVEIHPVEGVGRPFDPTKIRIVWRGEVG